jgi:gliding motility-associated-like protein
LSLAGAPTTTASITAKVLTVGGTFTTNNKVYDGTTAATLIINSLTLITKAGSDDVTLTAVAVFDDIIVGIGKTVRLTGSSLAGIDAPNYTLSLTGAPTTTANITEFSLTVTGITANNKVYDATTSAALNTGSATLSGIIGSDIVILVSTSATGTFVNKNVGSGKTVIINGLTLSGPDAIKYAVIQPTSTANITPSGLTVIGATADNKVYNGTTAATLNTSSATLSGVLGTDVVNLISSGAIGTFANKIVGTGKTVSTTGFTITGTNAGNYTLTQPSLTADITAAVLTITGATANNKVYDGTTTATLNTLSTALSGVLGADIVSLNSSVAKGTFVNKNVGTGKQVSTSGFTLGGTDAVNYSLTQPSLVANISAKSLTINANDISKYYGTTLTFTGTEYTTADLVPGDTVTNVTFTSTGAAASAAVGIYVISVTGGVNDNYDFTYINGLLTVNKSTLIATADNKTKVYGSATPVLTITYSGFKNNEDPSVLDVLPVASTVAPISNAGTYPILLYGGADNNYDLTLVNGSLIIEKKSLTITADDKTKVYGQMNPVLTITYSGFVLGQDQSDLDVLPIVETNANSNYSDAGKYSIDVHGGADGNYSFTYVNGVLTIYKADQVITFEEIPAGLRMTQEHQLVASASSGLTVTFETSNPIIGSVNGNILTLKQDGSLTITAKQAGNNNWNPAIDVTKSIVILPTFDNISSLFTPNNDGMNDYWFIPNLVEYGKVEVTVYNRFGKAVYHSDGYKNDWDGTWNGYPLPSASYYYIIKSSEKGIIKGVVNIVR